MGSVRCSLEIGINFKREISLAKARLKKEINDRLEPLVRVFYAPPFLDMHNRMKEALALLGRIRRAVVRPPLQTISNAERECIRAALVAAGLMNEVASLRAE